MDVREPAHLRHPGYRAEEWAADLTLFDERIHPEDEPAYREAERRSGASGEPLAAEYRMRARDGSIVWFQDQAVVVRDPDGRALFHQGIMYDVTESKRAQEILSAAWSASRRRPNGSARWRICESLPDRRRR